MQIESILQRGTFIYTKDTAEQTELVCEAASPAAAQWVAWSLAEFHGVPHKVEPAEADGPKIAIQVEGFVTAPVIQKLLVHLAGESDSVTDPALNELARRAAAAKVLQGADYMAETTGS
jgi:hypothetical protein